MRLKNPGDFNGIRTHDLWDAGATFNKVNAHEHDEPGEANTHACAQPFHPVIGSHGHLFRPCWISSAYHSQDTRGAF